MAFNFGFKIYLIHVGIRSSEYAYDETTIFENLEYFKKCYKKNISAYKALLFLADYLRGDFDFNFKN